VIALLADENFDHTILRGVLGRLPDADVAHVQELGLSGIDDDELLDRAAAMGRVLLTHDFNTLIRYAVERVGDGRPMPGVIAVKKSLPIGVAVDELVLAIACGLAEDFENQIRFLPIR
jgi:hypothetical protein